MMKRISIYSVKLTHNDFFLDISSACQENSEAYINFTDRQLILWSQRSALSSQNQLTISKIDVHYPPIMIFSLIFLQLAKKILELVLKEESDLLVHFIENLIHIEDENSIPINNETRLYNSLFITKADLEIIMDILNNPIKVSTSPRRGRFSGNMAVNPTRLSYSKDRLLNQMDRFVLDLKQNISGNSDYIKAKEENLIVLTLHSNKGKYSSWTMNLNSEFSANVHWLV